MFDIRNRLLQIGLCGVGVVSFIALYEIWHYQKQTVGIETFIGIDGTTSTHSRLPAFVTLTTRTATALDPSQDRLVLLRVDCNIRTFFDSPPIRSREHFVPILVTEMRPPAPANGTRIDLFWQATEKLLRTARRPTVIVLFSDYMADGVSAYARKQMRAVIGKIAENPHLFGVALIGVRDQAWGELERDLAPIKERLGPERCITGGEHDLSTTSLQRLLGDARSSTF